MKRPLSAAKARAVIEAAELAKAPTWREDRRWHVVADGQVLVIVEPSYSGTRRSGWRYWLADLGPSGNRSHQPTREAAAVAGLGAWERWITSRPTH